ncbi:MAG: HlyD family efflux transporter periplasmic adaptor subunit [Paraclostridium bifermentans]|uniref:HlyD family secretion protein n=1 Tax=Paraclostridium bifermentans TaxID=1490 RepID=UPI001DE60087|nr:HlyD family efflux transporter periplasmic adaptor subunit [Paraclostridium bifermentans]MBS6506803.1 HlyD family efflux transporter periplasmic adaptor subunit [Paraclostridium bifermentans]MDU3801577.1 HlyD family efflux transporter periplasmic adaptor subunit [Paraclostridium bifermentans]
MKVYNLNELTNSRLLYDKRPPKFLNFIILTVLVLFIGFIIWSTSSIKTFVVKGQGIISDEEKSSLMAKVSGEVDEVHIEEGQFVKKGDLLLTISAPDLDSQLSQVNDQIDLISTRIKFLKKAEKNAINKTNKFNKNDYDEIEFYNKLKASSSKAEEYKVDEESLKKQDYPKEQIKQIKKQSETKEKQIYYDTINDFTRERNQLDFELKKLEIQKNAISNSSKEYNLYASQNGTIHLITDIKEGMFIQAGLTLGSISNKNGNLIVTSMIQGIDRPRIHKNDEVSLAVGGLNQAEYGTLNGKVISIDEDSSIDNENGKVFFKIKIKPEKTYLEDKKREKVNLTSGMIVETRVKYERITYANYLLEQIGIQFN